MYIENGIVYAGERKPLLKIIDVTPLDGYKLRLQFSTGERKVFDFKPMLEYPAFLALKDEKLFKSVYLEYGVTTWLDGTIDIAPEKLYADGLPA